MTNTSVAIVLGVFVLVFMALINQNIGHDRENKRLYEKCLVENRTLTHEAATTLCKERVK